MLTRSSCQPETNLLDLPRELLAHIVLLAKESDSSYRQRKATRSEDETRMVAPSENEWTGRSLNALFMTCKTFHDLAATHLFSVLRTSTASKPIWKFELQELYASHVRALSFDLGPAPNQTALLLSAIALPNVNHVELAGLAVAELLRGYSSTGATEDLVDEESYALNCLRRLAARMDRLTLTDYPAERMSSTVAWFKNIKHLKIHSTKTLRPPSDLATIAFPALPNLSTLCLESQTRDVVLPAEWSSVDASPPHLSSFRLLTRHIHEPAWDFIGHLSADLGDLHLSARRDTTTFNFNPQRIFPRLRTLHIDASRDVIDDFLAAVRPSPLAHICLHIREDDPNPLPRNDFRHWKESLLTVVKIRKDHPVLSQHGRLLPTPRLHSLAPETWTAFTDFGADPFTSWREVDTLDVELKKGSPYSEAMCDVLEFGARLLLRCAREDDELVARSLMKALEPLRGLQYLQQLD
ncbi:hypothetical protein MNV49_006154 [Pseudohyphozyma bogoriensis]|nr:hypothetical protein MNV49_006154 [Pseudohyphozyma bogoriensis]